MPSASWNGARIAQADDADVHIVEGNVYFPPHAVDRAYLRDSHTHTFCPWKGTASYYDVVVDGSINHDAAWYYPDTKPKAAHIQGYIAFWRGVQVER
jgi:uncharacterized protein (DUF427 family)